MGHQGAGHPSRARLDATTARAVASTLQALAAPSRLLILESLAEGPLTVGEITETVGMEQSAVSHQLRLLRDLGFVVAERRGRHMLYRIFDSHVAELVNQAVFHAEHVSMSSEEQADGFEAGTAATH